MPVDILAISSKIQIMKIKKIKVLYLDGVKNHK